MIVLIVIIAVMVVIVATYAIEARNERRHRRMAESGHGVLPGLTLVDGADSPITAEGVMRGSYPPAQGYESQ